MSDESSPPRVVHGCFASGLTFRWLCSDSAGYRRLGPRSRRGTLGLSIAALRMPGDEYCVSYGTHRLLGIILVLHECSLRSTYRMHRYDIDRTSHEARDSIQSDPLVYALSHGLHLRDRALAGRSLCQCLSKRPLLSRSS